MSEEDQAAAIAAQNRKKLEEHLKKLSDSAGKDPGKGEYRESMQKGAFRKGVFEDDAKDPNQLRSDWEAWKSYHQGRFHDLGTPPPQDENDDYKILGLGKSASTAEIRKAFYKLAKTTHPDAGGDAGKFQILLEAYERLSGEAQTG